MHEKFSYVGASLTAWLAKLTLTTQDVIAIIGLGLSAVFTVWTFFSNRSEEKKRTAIMDNLATRLVQQNAPPATIAAVAKIMKTDVPAKDVKEAVTDGTE